MTAAASAEPVQKKKGKPRGKPFSPGASGNPGGQSKTIPEVRDFLRSKSMKAAIALGKIVDGETFAETKEIIAACKVILDFSVAKPRDETDSAEKTAVLSALAELLTTPRG